ncbi:MAG: hypothetical protein O7E52_28290 [Candidatus Poribacteria bacterium]|nr:hypothetical protein [Candidatus Poribacteria bacterium]
MKPKEWLPLFLFICCLSTLLIACGDDDDDDDDIDDIPTIPEGLTAQSEVDGVALTWQKSENTARYNIYRSEQQNEGFKLIGTADSMAFKDTTAILGTEYFYKVAGVSPKTEGIENVGDRSPPVASLFKGCNITDLQRTSGDGQEGEVTEILRDWLAVEVSEGKDSAKKVCPRIPVRFEITKSPPDSTGQVLSDDQGNTGDELLVRTNDKGETRVRMKLGNKSGDYEVTATVDGFNKVVIFELTAEPGPPDKLIKVDDGRRREGVVGQKLDPPLRVRLVDKHENGIPGERVAGDLITATVPEVEDPFVQAKISFSEIGPEGFAEGDLTLSTKAGEQTVTVGFGNLPSEVSFSVIATPNRSEPIIVPVSDISPPTRPAGTALPSPFVVRVQDKGTNPLPAFRVTFRVVESPDPKTTGGSVSTDGDGLARFTLTLGDKPGQYIVEAFITAEEKQKITFIATAGPHTIRQILQNPEGFKGKEVTLWGEVVKEHACFIFGKVYTISDGTGKICVDPDHDFPRNVNIEVTGKVNLAGDLCCPSDADEVVLKEGRAKKR